MVRPQVGHDLGHLVHAGQALELKAVHLVQVAAVLAVNALQLFLDGGADAAVVGGHFADQHAADDGVLIPHIAAGQVAVALLEAEDEPLHFPGGLQLGDLVADPLEAGQHVAALHTIVGGHLVRQRGGHDGLHHHGVGGHGALRNAAGADVIQQQNAHLVAAQQLIAAVLAAHGNAHAVGVRVGGQHQVRAALLRQLQAQAQGLEDLGVWVGAGGEVAVRVLLLGHDGHIGDAQIFQDAGHRHQAAAVQRAVHQLQPGGGAQAGAHAAAFNGLIQGLAAVVLHILDQPGRHALFKGHGLGAGQHVGLLNLGVHHIGRLVGHLAAIGAIGLVAVVLGGVVAGRYHNAGVALVIPGGKAQGRHRHQGLINAHLYAVGRQHLGRRLCEHIAFDAAVVADGHGLAATLGLNPVGQALGGLPHHIHVHAVGARTDHAAQAGGAELQRHGKALFDGLFVTGNGGQLRGKIRVIQVCGAPARVFFLIHIFHLLF